MTHPTLDAIDLYKANQYQRFKICICNSFFFFPLSTLPLLISSFTTNLTKSTNARPVLRVGECRGKRMEVTPPSGQTIIHRCIHPHRPPGRGGRIMISSQEAMKRSSHT